MGQGYRWALRGKDKIETLVMKFLRAIRRHTQIQKIKFKKLEKIEHICDK
jgi:hypothetical protein